jgi:hypothetical protein
MLNHCRVCQSHIPQWHNVRSLDAPPVAERWSKFCLPCRIRARINARWYLSGYTW